MFVQKSDCSLNSIFTALLLWLFMGLSVISRFNILLLPITRTNQLWNISRFYVHKLMILTFIYRSLSKFMCKIIDIFDDFLNKINFISQIYSLENLLLLLILKTTLFITIVTNQIFLHKNRSELVVKIS